VNPIDNPERARQLARTIAGDIAIYNEKKVEAGILADNLFEALSAEIEEGRQHYKARVTPEIFALNFFDRAVVDSMLRPMVHLRAKIW
jgi:hypothetical protein